MCLGATCRVGWAVPFPGLQVRSSRCNGVCAGGWRYKNRRLRSAQFERFSNIVDRRGRFVDLHSFPAKSARVQDYCVFEGMREGWYAVTNQDLGVGFALVYPPKTYPYLWYWQVFGGGSGWPWYRRTYNVGLEPFTSLANGQPKSGSSKRTALVLSAEKVDRCGCRRLRTFPIPG